LPVCWSDVPVRYAQPAAMPRHSPYVAPSIHGARLTAGYQPRAPIQTGGKVTVFRCRSAIGQGSIRYCGGTDGLVPRTSGFSSTSTRSRKSLPGSLAPAAPGGLRPPPSPCTSSTAWTACTPVLGPKGNRVCEQKTASAGFLQALCPLEEGLQKPGKDFGHAVLAFLHQVAFEQLRPVSGRGTLTSSRW
jgi:hypothetical protein